MLNFEKRASYLEIIARILITALKPCIQHQIIRKCRLSTAQWQKYREFLINAALIEAEPKAKNIYYKTTEKGKTFLQKYVALLSLLETPCKSYQTLNILTKQHKG